MILGKRANRCVFPSAHTLKIIVSLVRRLTDLLEKGVIAPPSSACPAPLTPVRLAGRKADRGQRTLSGKRVSPTRLRQFRPRRSIEFTLAQAQFPGRQQRLSFDLVLWEIV